MEIVVNGEPRTAEVGQTILGLLLDLGLEPARVAVEFDRRIVKQSQWPETVLRDGARVEIVQFVAGPCGRGIRSADRQAGRVARDDSAAGVAGGNRAICGGRIG